MAEEGHASLAKLLDEDSCCRRLGRANKMLTQWNTKESVGVASVQHMVLNYNVLMVVAEWWVPQVEAPKPIPIDVLRSEAFTPKMFFKVTWCWVF